MITQLVVVLLLAQTPPDVRRVFPWQSELTLKEGEGLSVLTLTPDVLAHCSHKDLGDLRLITTAGKEVPYSLHSPLPTPKVTAQTLPAEVREAEHQVTKDEAGRAWYTERFEVFVPATLPQGSWQLAMQTTRATFVRRVTIAPHDPNATPNVGSIFRLPNAPEKLSLPLPAARGASVTVTLEGEDAYITPKLSFVRSGESVEVAPMELPLTVRKTLSQGGHTQYVLERPAAWKPFALRVATRTANFMRPTQVFAGSDRLGQTFLIRLSAGSQFSENLDLPISFHDGRVLKVDIQDGDSPPLEDVSFTALVYVPWLVFKASPGENVLLYFGGGRVATPDYDLQGLRLDASGAFTRPTLGPRVANPLYVQEKALAFAMHPGAAVNVGAYARTRSLTVSDTPEGISTLVLQGEDLAASRADLRDIRVVDESGHGWPYLLERAGEDSWEAVTLEPLPPERKLSCWRIVLPPGGGRLDGLTFDADIPFVQRGYKLTRESRGGASIEFEGTLQRRQGETRPFEISLASLDTIEAQLRINDGDDAPLSPTQVRGHFVTPVMYLAAPAGEYQLVVGLSADTAPDYGLVAARDLVLAVDAPPMTADALVDNPTHTWHAQLTSGAESPQILVWVALCLVVVGLGVLTLRLVRNP